MNVTEYRAAGFAIALQMEQAVIDRAEADIRAAYIEPLLGSEYEPNDTTQRAVMALSFLLMQQRNAAVTRAGGKVKNVNQSYTPTFEEVLQQNAATCTMWLQKVAEYGGVADWWSKVRDICRINFKSNFLAM